MSTTDASSRTWLSGSIRGRVAAVCVLAALAIDLAGGRWGAYIGTPLPRVYLADLLWAIGAVLAIRLSALRALPRASLVAAAVAVVYAVLRLVTSAGGAGVETTLLVRDLAPLGYLAAVPLVAVALAGVGARTMLWLLRIAPLAIVAGTGLHFLGVSTSGVGRMLGGAELAVMRFPGRDDILGVIIAVGIVAWGRFELAPTRGWPAAVASRVVQVGLVVCGFLVPSQASQLVAVVAVAWAVLRELVPVTPRRAVVAGLAIVIALGALSAAAVGTALVLAKPATEAIRVANPGDGPDPDGERPTVAGRQRAMYAIPGLPVSLDTVGARLETWASVVHASAEDGTWLAGAGLGRPDRLLEVCDVTLAEYVEQPRRNKCQVDSGATPLPLRDPHTWSMNLLLYQGVLGIVVLSGVLLAMWWRPPADPDFSLAAVPAVLFLIAATVGVVLSSPFGILPIATFTAYALSRRLRAPRPDRVAVIDNL